MFKTNHGKLLAFTLGVVATAIAWQVESHLNKSGTTETMNDRIIAETAKCSAAGMLAEVERQSFGRLYGGDDEFFVVCKTLEIKGIDKLRLELQQNPKRFESAVKRTQ
ncbi:MAG: hypothetical protein RR740_00460 [Pseudomonas sp.]